MLGLLPYERNCHSNQAAVIQKLPSLLDSQSGVRRERGQLITEFYSKHNHLKYFGKSIDRISLQKLKCTSPGVSSLGCLPMDLFYTILSYLLKCEVYKLHNVDVTWKISTKNFFNLYSSSTTMNTENHFDSKL